MLYLLYGIGGDEFDWLNGGQPQVIMDNLCAENKIEPMIVVLSNGRARKDDRAGGNISDLEKVQAFATFEQNLLNDLIFMNAIILRAATGTRTESEQLD